MPLTWFSPVVARIFLVTGTENNAENDTSQWTILCKCTYLLTEHGMERKDEREGEKRKTIKKIKQEIIDEDNFFETLLLESVICRL